jgi:hypothetical protein
VSLGTGGIIHRWPALRTSLANYVRKSQSTGGTLDLRLPSFKRIAMVHPAGCDAVRYQQRRPNVTVRVLNIRNLPRFSLKLARRTRCSQNCWSDELGLRSPISGANKWLALRSGQRCTANTQNGRQSLLVSGAQRHIGQAGRDGIDVCSFPGPEKTRERAFVHDEAAFGSHVTPLLREPSPPTRTRSIHAGGSSASASASTPARRRAFRVGVPAEPDAGLSESAWEGTAASSCRRSVPAVASGSTST